MPDTLNKQSIINLLIDSPLREPIKINLIDIVNNTSEADLPKVYPTIIKELEIFQKATERRMKLADETIAKLSGNTPAVPNAPDSSVAQTPPLDSTASTPPTPPPQPQALPPLDLPPLPSTPPATDTTSQQNESTGVPSSQPLSVPPLDLPPLPTSPSMTPPNPPVAPEAVPPTMPSPQPLGTPPVASSSDEDALAEIQKELDSLKSSTAADIASAGQTPEPATPASPAPTA